MQVWKQAWKQVWKRLRRGIPNALTILRLLLGPAVFYNILQDEREIALILFLGALLTDFLDGQIARRYHLESAFGRLVDPIADKILVGSVVFAVLLQNKLWWWMGYASVAVVGFVVGYRYVVHRKIHVSRFGRMAILGVFAILALFILGFVSQELLVVLAALVLVPAAHYVWQALSSKKRKI